MSEIHDHTLPDDHIRADYPAHRWCEICDETIEPDDEAFPYDPGDDSGIYTICAACDLAIHGPREEE